MMMKQHLIRSSISLPVSTKHTTRAGAKAQEQRKERAKSQPGRIAVLCGRTRIVVPVPDDSEEDHVDDPDDEGGEEGEEGDEGHEDGAGAVVA